LLGGILGVMRHFTDIDGRRIVKIDIRTHKLPDFDSASLNLVQFSGGKDSVVVLDKALKEAALDRVVVPVFFDTGWEHELTYQYLEQIATYFDISILWIHGPTLKDLILKYKKFPFYGAKFCTRELKVRQMKRLLQRLKGEINDVIVTLGVRKQESRLNILPPKEEVYLSGKPVPLYDNNKFSFTVRIRRPIVDWTDKQVWRYINDRKLPINPLYERGHQRIGCYPCFLGERSIRDVIADAILFGDDLAIDRIQEIRKLELEVGGPCYPGKSIIDFLQED